MSNDEIVSDRNDETIESGTIYNMSFQPQDEEQLIGFAKWLKSREHHSIIKARWALGSKINENEGAVYGEDTAGRIAEEVGYSKSTVNKCRKFARMYSPEQVSSLLNGSFSLSWRDITQNLSVSTDDFLRIYDESSTLDEFRNAVTQLRPEGTNQRRPRQPRITRAQLETENNQLRSRVEELESEKARLRRRVEELERQLEAAGAGPDVIQDLESVD